MHRESLLLLKQLFVNLSNINPTFFSVSGPKCIIANRRVAFLRAKQTKRGLTNCLQIVTLAWAFQYKTFEWKHYRSAALYRRVGIKEGELEIKASRGK